MTPRPQYNLRANPIADWRGCKNCKLQCTSACPHAGWHGCACENYRATFGAWLIHRALPWLWVVVPLCVAVGLYVAMLP